MLETEEVDDDFFTPVASTSLASIFGNISKINESTENDSLKYVPPKPQSNIPKKSSPVKTTECVFACVLMAHEWCNNVYTSKGKLGFAIIKIQKSGDHNIVLYDSNKTPLSNTVITAQLEVTIKNDAYISFYDNLQKYWSLYGTSEEVKKIDSLLKSLRANINYFNHPDQELLQPNNSEIEPTTALDENAPPNRESDTDSSVNRKTKASILTRMANMGQSVLPSRNLPVQRSSDSSDTNDIDTQTKAVRHKPAKPYVKRYIIDNMSDPQQTMESDQRVVITNTQPEKCVTLFNHHSKLLTNTGVIANTSNEFSMYMTEQRINNSELRINLNRVTDKLDTIVNKINTLESKDKYSNVSTDILLKLLTEYENKIKVYEELLNSKGMIETKVTDDQSKLTSQEVDILKIKISEIEKMNADKENEICNLHKEITLLKDIQSQDKKNLASREKDLTIKINNLEVSLEEKTKQLIDLTNTVLSHDNIQDKVKNIMNDTFQTISNNFEDSDRYTGEAIKRIVGTVIKKITITKLKELNQN